MRHNYLWTNLKTRLNLIKSNPGQSYNWLFIAGGPGLGSESLANLTNILELPGTIWHLDLPGDGSNVLENPEYYFERWTEALVEAVGALDKVIIAGHSMGGMYTLASPKLKEMLHGLVLMDSAPDASWQQSFIEFSKKKNLPEVDRLQKIYANNKTNENIKNLILASLTYCFTPEGLTKDLSFFEHLPYNFEACEWSDKNFDKTYKAAWIPDNIPTLIFAGDQDGITPLTIFQQAKDFKKENIKIYSIQNAGHFPWIENPVQVKKLFEEYVRSLK